MPKKRLKGHHCDNCGYQFRVDADHDNYCPSCGQENHNPRQPLFHYIGGLLEGLFHLDHKIWISLRTLLFKPGTITKDFIENKRARYTPPMRMFIFSLAFFALSLEIAQESMVKIELHDKMHLTLDMQIAQLPDTALISFSAPFYTGTKIYFTVAQLRELKTLAPANISAWLQSHQLPSGLVYRLQARMAQQNIHSHNTVADFQRHITRQHYWLILITLPITAALIYIFFYRQGLLYYDTLVMALHIYSFAMVFGIAISLTVMQLIKLSLVQDTTIILPLVQILSIFLNFIPAYKKVFGLSWPGTVLRALVISSLNLALHIILYWTIAGYGIF